MRIKNKKTPGNIQYIESDPNNNGIVINNPPQAFLEKVRKEAIPIVIININELDFFKMFFVCSWKMEIEKGQMIESQHPA